MPALDYTTAKKALRAILQATRTTGGYASTVDGSKAQYSLDAELDNALLYADAEVCNVIVNTPGHPFQYNFVTTSSALQNGATLPLHTGMILKVTCLNAASTVAVASYTAATDLITTSASHGFSTGTKVQLSGNIIGGGLSSATDYYVINVSDTTLRLATTPYNAYRNSYIDLSAVEPDTVVINPQYVEGIQAKSADEVREIFANGGVYKSDISADNSMLPFWFIEGDVLLTSAQYAKVVYTTFTLSSSPQAPEPYMNAVVAGAAANVLKDGGDDQLASYYMGIFQKNLEMIRQGVRLVPALTASKLQQAG